MLSECLASELLAPEVAKVIVGATCVGKRPAAESCHAITISCGRVKKVGSKPLSAVRGTGESPSNESTGLSKCGSKTAAEGASLLGVLASSAC